MTLKRFNKVLRHKATSEETQVMTLVGQPVPEWSASAYVSDLGVGRSPSEVLPTVQALQSGGLCGADWKKGDEFVG